MPPQNAGYMYAAYAAATAVYAGYAVSIWIRARRLADRARARTDAPPPSRGR
jgi:hypothetical protein